MSEAVVNIARDEGIDVMEALGRVNSDPQWEGYALSPQAMMDNIGAVADPVTGAWDKSGGLGAAGAPEGFEVLSAEFDRLTKQNGVPIDLAIQEVERIAAASGYDAAEVQTWLMARASAARSMTWEDYLESKIMSPIALEFGNP